MNKIKNILKLLVIGIILLNITSTPVLASSGWIPVHTITNKWLGYRIDISPSHYGYTKDGRKFHFNVVGYINGQEMCNVHIYRDKGAQVFWESRSGKYIRIGGNDNISGGIRKMAGMLQNYAEEIAGYISLTAVVGFMAWLMSNAWEIVRNIPYYI